MGEIYEALDSALGEIVALKTLAITTADQADAARRLLAEVRIARKVVHPNVSGPQPLVVLFLGAESVQTHLDAVVVGHAADTPLGK